jgi:hypothetical protein
MSMRIHSVLHCVCATVVGVALVNVAAVSAKEVPGVLRTYGAFT